MRNRYVVCYDIADSKRLRLMHRKMLGFGDPIQYSVFVCPLSPVEKALMLDAISDIVVSQEDRVTIIDIGPVTKRPRRDMQFIGEPLVRASEYRSVVV